MVYSESLCKKTDDEKYFFTSILWQNDTCVDKKQEIADVVTVTEEVVNRKLYFLCSIGSVTDLL